MGEIITTGKYVWGVHEIAEYLGVAENLVSQWKRRGKLPAPDTSTARQDLWWPETIKQWERTQK